MTEDALLKMYEAQAIAIEKEAEASRLRRENEELTEELRQLQRETEGGVSADRHQAVTTAITALQEVVEKISLKMEKMEEKQNELCDRFQERLAPLEEAVRSISTPVGRNEMGGKAQNSRITTDGVSEKVFATADILLEGIERVLAKVEQLGEKQNENHTKIMQRLIPLGVEVENSSKRVDKCKTIMIQVGKNSHKLQDEIQMLNKEKEQNMLSKKIDKIINLNQALRPALPSTMLLLGGITHSKAYPFMTTLNRDRSKWSILPLKLPKAFAAGGAVYLDDELYIFGGTLCKESYKMGKHLKWARLTDMNDARVGIQNSCLEWNGSIWVFGGLDLGNFLKTVERYDPIRNTWTKMRDMKYARSSAAAAVWNGKFIVCGGRNGDKDYARSVECYDPESGVWTELNNTPLPVAGHSIVSYGNDLILLGGRNRDGYFSTVLEMNLEGKGKWKELPPLRKPRSCFSATVVDNEIFVVGGWDEAEINKTEVFNGKSWQDGPYLPYGLQKTCSVVIPQYLADFLCNYPQ